MAFAAATLLAMSACSFRDAATPSTAESNRAQEVSQLSIVITPPSEPAATPMPAPTITDDPEAPHVATHCEAPHGLVFYEVPVKANDCEVPTTIPINGEPIENPWKDCELNAIARALAGECYDDKEDDKRMVCEVILNRVSNGAFGNGILGVLTAQNAFNGYWFQPRPVSDNDYAVAEQTLRDWYKNGCKPLSEYLYFCKGENRENMFRANY